MTREGGGVIIYVNNKLTFETLISISDEVCSLLGIYINEINLIVFMVYRPPPNYKNKFHGEILEQSFENIVINNIYSVMNKYKAQVPDMILTGDYNFPKAIWSNGIGKNHGDTLSNTRSFQKLAELAAELNLLQIGSVFNLCTKTGSQIESPLLFLD